MAYHIVWTDIAKEDIRAVIEYLKLRWSATTAEKFIDNFYTQITLISNQPFIGIASDKYKNVRRILITKHNALFYRVENSTITLLSLFDTRQNPDKNPYD